MTDVNSYMVTHPGAAHVDDVLSMAWLISHDMSDKIDRREPEPEELENPNVWVVDIGEELDVVDKNFDHHQFPADAPPVCAFSLLLKASGEYEEWCETFSWVKAIEEMDSKGPYSVANRIGADATELLPFLYNPLMTYVTDKVAKLRSIEPGDFVWTLLEDIGRKLLEKVQEVRDRCSHYSRTAGLSQEAGLTVLHLDTEDTLGLQTWLRKQDALSPDMGFMHVDLVSLKDNRGDGLALMRRNDSPAVDFSQCEGMDGVVFAHKGGFVCKIAADADWDAIVRKAATEGKTLAQLAEEKEVQNA